MLSAHRTGTMSKTRSFKTIFRPFPSQPYCQVFLVNYGSIKVTRSVTLQKKSACTVVFLVIVFSSLHVSCFFTDSVLHPAKDGLTATSPRTGSTT